MPRERVDELRRRWHILVDGDDVPPPARCFGDLRPPEPILRTLHDKGIEQPTANTSAGATRRALRAGHDRHRVHGVRLKEAGSPERRPMLCTGGVDMKTLMEVVKKGVHIVVATPGRLKDLLAKKKMNLDTCRYLTLDGADRLVDLGFEEDIWEVFAHFKAQRQTLLFSATMLEKIQNFAKSALVKPVIVNVGRAGAANLDVIQEVEYVKEDTRIIYLLECLQKTPPPVLVFCEHKADVDYIHEFLPERGRSCCDSWRKRW